MEKDNNLEELRSKLYEMLEHNSLLSNAVIELSKKMDLEIIKYIKINHSET
ncbi:aspartyl-phosphate phosphatase Spo0E family protein [Clostridium hydrogenum]|uniref:aspartyl-phosphate phosphatase Spo0E family protein n=1 Tax=Clostridium hydrogenum TaxID=2855764 RepID=UPI001F1B81EF|nr:aspartyl-phosphate phosphatase Spo0E family protein [Clostridium hydrogenum]